MGVIKYYKLKQETIWFVYYINCIQEKQYKAGVTSIWKYTKL